MIMNSNYQIQNFRMILKNIKNLIIFAQMNPLKNIKKDLNNLILINYHPYQFKIKDVI